MVMKKKGVSTLVLIVLAIFILAVAGLAYYHTTNVGLTPEEQKTAERLDLTPKEFKDVSTKARGIFEEHFPELEGKSQPTYADYGTKNGNKVILAILYPGAYPSPMIQFEITDEGEVKVLAQDLEAGGL